MESSRKLSEAENKSNQEMDSRLFHHELNELRDLNVATNTRLDEAQRQTEQRRPQANGLTKELIDEAKANDIDMNVSFLVVSKAKKYLNQHVSLLRHTLNANNTNLFMRACLNDLMILHDQADHSINGNPSKKGPFPPDIINLLQGQK